VGAHAICRASEALAVIAVIIGYRVGLLSVNHVSNGTTEAVTSNSHSLGDLTWYSVTIEFKGGKISASLS
jgi:hypothetical protein